MTAFDKAWGIVKGDSCLTCGKKIDNPDEIEHHHGHAWDSLSGPYCDQDCWIAQKAYSREEAEADILNSPFAEGLGWIDENGLTEAGKDVAAQYVSEKKMCPECDVPEGDGSCSECLTQQREEGRYDELWDE